MIRIISLKEEESLRKQMQQIGVDPYGIKIMLPKAASYVVRINSISNITANILKQEMLSLGGDAAVSRDALTGKTKQTGCLIIANLAQFNRLREKLARQPFGLNRIAADLSRTLDNFRKHQFEIDLGRFKLRLGTKTNIMGIINLTPDSFSQDGFYRCPTEKIVDFAEHLISDGADIIDLGAESSRPGAKPLPVKEELKRTIPVIKALAKKIKRPISIDTYKAQVAQQALENGASIVNDISALSDPKMGRLIAKYKAGCVLMHMRGRPQAMQRNVSYISLIDEILGYLQNALGRAEEAGINREMIIVDPGIGFGKKLEHNLEILDNLRELKVLGRPLLVGPSRKSFLGKILHVLPQERIFGTVASCVAAAYNGAHIVRVHDVKAVRQALKVLNKISA